MTNEEMFTKIAASPRAALRNLRRGTPGMSKATFARATGRLNDAAEFEAERNIGRVANGEGHGVGKGWVNTDLKDKVDIALKGAGAIGATALGLNYLGKGGKDKSNIRKSERELVKQNPNLQHMDKDKIKQYMGVVKQYSPKAAANPLVAGGLVNKMNQFGGVDHKLVQDLAAIQNSSKNESPSTSIKLL